MSDQKLQSEWRVIGTSVRGAAHERSGLPNQDRIIWTPESGAGLPLIVSLSDGHGSTKAFRSDTGAELAVRAAQTACRSFLTSETEPLHPSSVKRWAEESLPRDIVRRWTDDVADDLAARPITKAELDQLRHKEGAEKQRQLALNPILAYGATSLTAVFTESFILYLQLGDGDILAVSETGEVSRPLPKDERLIANETTSLSSEKAWRDFRAQLQVVSASPPALIVVSSDGYGNSFRDDTDFLKVGPDILEALRSEGLDKVNAKLGDWLTDASKTGSGDDISVGIICRTAALQVAKGNIEAPEKHDPEKVPPPAAPAPQESRSPGQEKKETTVDTAGQRSGGSLREEKGLRWLLRLTSPRNDLR